MFAVSHANSALSFDSAKSSWTSDNSRGAGMADGQRTLQVLATVSCASPLEDGVLGLNPHRF